MNRPHTSSQPRIRVLSWILLCAFSLPALALTGCETAAPKFRIPARISYMEAEGLENEGVISEAIEKYQQIADENTGTLLGTFSFLKMADLNFELSNWEEAETNYRLFLTTNQNSHLTSYVLYKLVVVQHRKSITGLFFPSREIERNMEPNRRIIQEFQRFFFLYPNSVFLKEIRSYLGEAHLALAAHEHMVADFYFERDQFNAAVSRYLYLLKNFPNYPESEEVLKRLILSYRRNQQPELADELERFYKTGFERWRNFDKNTGKNTGKNAEAGKPPRSSSAIESQGRETPGQGTRPLEKNRREKSPREMNPAGLTG